MRSFGIRAKIDAAIRQWRAERAAITLVKACVRSRPGWLEHKIAFWGLQSLLKEHPGPAKAQGVAGLIRRANRIAELPATLDAKLALESIYWFGGDEPEALPSLTRTDDVEEVIAMREAQRSRAA